MLAAKDCDPEALRYPVLASAKHDGIRCVIREGRALARSLKPIPNVHIRTTLEALGADAEGFDGEIMLPAPAKFGDVSSAVMSHDAKPPADWFFVVFDRVPAIGTAPAIFADRLVDTQSTIAAGRRHARGRERSAWMHVQHCDHVMVCSAAELRQYEDAMIAAGHEGVMIRSIDGPYKYGRATEREATLLKLKRFDDGEAVILSVEELQHNRNAAFTGELGQTKRRTLKAGKVAGDMLGKLHVRDTRSGVTFRIGTGFSLKQKRGWWRCRDTLIGRVVKYRWQTHGTKDKPRIASFVGFRDARDMGPG